MAGIESSLELNNAKFVGRRLTIRLVGSQHCTRCAVNIGTIGVLRRLDAKGTELSELRPAFTPQLVGRVSASVQQRARFGREDFQFPTRLRFGDFSNFLQGIGRLGECVKMLKPHGQCFKSVTDALRLAKIARGARDGRFLADRHVGLIGLEISITVQLQYVVENLILKTVQIKVGVIS